jgi:hypothetical protein
MAEANRALAQQLARLDSVMPHIENEISEESRLGSLTHWAYQDNRAKKQTTTSQNERNRRDVAATSSLAAAAAAVHDQDIAAARGEARREAKKTSRTQAVDSDFDDRPTKRTQTGKSRKNADAEPKASGLGIANGTANAAPTKRRKVEKAPAVAGAPAMERSASNMSTVAKAARGAGNTTPRSTPAVETTTKKKGKPGPAPGTGAGKKRYTSLSFSESSNQLTRPTGIPPSTRSQTPLDYPTRHLYWVMHNYNPRPFPDLPRLVCARTQTRRQIYSTRCFRRKRLAVQRRSPTTNPLMAVLTDSLSRSCPRPRR